MISYFEIWVSLKYLLPKTREKFFSIITIFSFVGIALGVATLIIVMSVMNGFREELTSKVLGVNGHLKIQPFNNQKIKDNEQLKYLVNSNFDNIKISEVLLGQGLLNFRGFSTGSIIKGVQSDYFEDRKIFKENIDSKSLKNFELNKGVFVGTKLKEKLRLKIGDSINIISPDSIETIFGNLPRSSNFKIIGFFSTGMYEYDSSLVYVPLRNMQSFLNSENKINFFEIQIDDFDNIDTIRNKLEDLIPKYFRIIDWRELNPSLFNAIEVEKNVMFLILLLIILVAAFNLISSMIILVSSKNRDIGVLRVMGVSKNQILKIFMMSGLAIGVCGTILGIIIGLLFCFNINEIKSFFELFLDSELFSEEIYFFSRLPVIMDFAQISKIVTISLVLSFLATIYPAIKASKVEPINLIKWD